MKKSVAVAVSMVGSSALAFYASNTMSENISDEISISSQLVNSAEERLLTITSPPKASPAKVSRASDEIVISIMEEAFNDPGDATARELATLENISVKEARHRLDLMNRLGIVAKKLKEADPNNFGGVAVTNQGGFKLTLATLNKSSASLQSELTSLDPVLANAPELDLKTARRSEKDLRKLAKSMRAELKSTGVNVDYAIDFVNGDIKLLSDDPESLRRSLNSNSLSRSVPLVNDYDDIKVEKFSGIQVTSLAWAQGAYAYNAKISSGNYQNCTGGFPLGNVPYTGKRYHSSAGHCANLANYNILYNTIYEDKGSALNLTFRAEHTIQGVDLQWSSAADANILPVPEIYDADIDAVLRITGSQSDYAGLFVCKLGRTTRKTCGYVDPYQYSDSYGDFPRVNSNSYYPKLNDSGDSGAPVYTGSLSVGWVHGKDAAGNMYYTPVRHVLENNVGVSPLAYAT